MLTTCYSVSPLSVEEGDIFSELYGKYEKGLSRQGKAPH